MANQFSIEPLGGFNLGQALSGLGQQFGQMRQEDERAAQQQQMQQLFMGAAQGDSDSMNKLWGSNPEMAQMFEQRNADKFASLGAAKAMESKKAETDWGLQWIRATPEQKPQLLQEALNNELIDIDQDDVGIEGEQADLAVNSMLYSHLGKDAYRDLGLAGDVDKGFTLSEGQKRFSSTGEQIASVAQKSAYQTQIPQVLLEGLSEDLAIKASAAYNAAGGGKDGMVAYQRQIDKGTEQEKRLASPSILKANFPQASTAEMSQLQGTMDAARTTETGLKAASKVRVEQKRLVKAKGFQDRAIDLLTSILNNDELGDVLGSVEGSYDFRLQDSESELIADIEEAGNILTADNLSLMSGVLSESDIKILKNLAGGGLIRTRSKERFVKDVTTLKDKLSSAMVVTTDERDQSNKGDMDAQALEWAQANPDNPKSEEILKRLKIKGKL